MKIGQVAKAAGIGIDAVRFYERRGLIPKPGRQPSGYRVYAPDVVLNLQFIRSAQSLGFSLAEIGELISLEDQPDARAADVKELAQARLDDIEDRVRKLNRMKRALKKVVQGCSGQGPIAGCSILKALREENAK